MNESQLRSEVLFSLGHPILCIELTPAMLRTIIEKTYRWFNSHRGLRARDRLTLLGGENEYPLGANVLDVTHVFPPLRSDEITGFFGGDFGGFGGVFIGGLAFGGAATFGGITPYGGRFGGEDQLPLSGINQIMQYSEMWDQQLSADFEWEFFHDGLSGNLIIAPIPSEGGDLEYEYVKRMTDIIELQEGSRDLDMLVRWAQAEAKEVVGRIRRKFDNLPGAEDAVSLDGDRLLDDAATEKEALNTEIAETAFPMGMMGR